MGTTLSSSASDPGPADGEARAPGPLAAWGPALGLLAVGLALRGYRFTADELWPDEAFFGWVSGLSLAEVLPVAWRENTPPLGHLLVWLSERLLGPGEAALRMPFLLLGSLLPPAVYLVGRRLLGPRVAAFAGAIVALSPIHISYSQIARVYALLPLAALLSAATLWFLIDRRRRSDVILHGVVAAVAIWTHQWGVLLLPCGYVAALLARIPGGGKRVLAAHGVTLALCLPLLPGLRPNPEQQELVSSFYVPVWESTPPALAIPKSLEGLWAGGAHARPTTMKLARAVEEVRKAPQGAALEAYAAVPRGLWRVVCWASLIYLLIAGIWRRGDDALEAHGVAGKRIVLVTYLAGPLLLGWLASALVTPIYLVGRHDVIALPFLALLAAMGACKFRAPVRGAAIAVYALLAFVSLLPFYLVPYAEGNRATAAYLGARVVEGDVVIYTGYRQAPVEYYLRPRRLPAATLTLPPSMEKWPAGIPLRRYEEDRSLVAREATEVVREALSNRRETGYVYVVPSAGDWVPALMAGLEERLGAAEQVGANGMTLLRFGGPARDE